MLIKCAPFMVDTGNGKILEGRCDINAGSKSGSERRDQPGDREDVRAGPAMLSSQEEEPAEHEAMCRDPVEYT